MNDNIPTHELTSESSSSSNNLPLILGGIAVVGVVGFIAVKTLGKDKASLQPVTGQDTPSMVQEAKDSTAPTTEDTTAASGAPATSPTATTGEGTSQVKTFALEAGSFYFSLKEIKVKKGETVKIVLTSKDMMHDFNIDELKVKLPVTKAGETNSIEFVADKAGTFEYYCSVAQHRKMGQVGTLIVE